MRLMHYGRNLLLSTTNECYCPILGRCTNVRETAFSRGPWRIVQCCETGFVFLQNPPEYESLEEDFAWDKTTVVERDRRRREEPVLSRISAFTKTIRQYCLPKHDKLFKLSEQGMAKQPTESTRSFTIVDVGCGEGKQLASIAERLSARGLSVVPLGIEISTKLAQVANHRLEMLGGGSLASSAIGGVQRLPSGSVDLFLMSSFLEHEARPLELLRAVSERLTDNGRVVLKVPNFSCWNRLIRGAKWCGFRYPDHVNYFTPDSLSALSSNAGLVVIRQNFVDRSPLSDNMYAVLGKATKSNHAVNSTGENVTSLKCNAA